MDERPGSPRIDELLDEAIELNIGLEALAEEGAEALRGAGAIKRAVAAKYLRDGTGLTLDGLRDEAHSKTMLLAALRSDETGLPTAGGRLRAYAALVSRVAAWIEGLEPMARQRIRDPETRARILTLAEEHLAGGRRLAAILGLLAEEGERRAGT